MYGWRCDKWDQHDEIYKVNQKYLPWEAVIILSQVSTHLCLLVCMQYELTSDMYTSIFQPLMTAKEHETLMCDSFLDRRNSEWNKKVCKMSKQPPETLDVSNLLFYSFVDCLQRPLYFKLFCIHMVHAVFIVIEGVKRIP